MGITSKTIIFFALSLFGMSVAAPLEERRNNLPSPFGGVHTGQGTFYEPGLGACGITNTGSDSIVAISQSLFDTFPGFAGGNPNNNPVCGRSLTATFEGKSATVNVVDRCVGCAESDLDFSPSAFQELTNPSVGRISGVTWSFD